MTQQLKFLVACTQQFDFFVGPTELFTFERQNADFKAPRFVTTSHHKATLKGEPAKRFRRVLGKHLWSSRWS
jgi:hypothetical protein